VVKDETLYAFIVAGPPDKTRDAVVDDLVAALKFRDAVMRALPINEEADRAVAAMLNKRPAGYVPRKLKPRAK
jgi:hypothetical protein